MKFKDIFEEVFNEKNKLGDAITKASLASTEASKAQQELTNLIGQAQEDDKKRKEETIQLEKDKQELEKQKAKFNDMVKKEQIKKAQEQAIAQAQNQAKQVATNIDLAIKENK